MATIKVPYTYKNYPFSAKATKLSKRMSKNKGTTGIFTGMIAFVIVGSILGNISFFREGAMSLVTMVLAVAASVAFGRYMEKYRAKLYKEAIVKALEEDLNKLYSNQPELVRSNLEMLKADLG